MNRMSPKMKELFIVPVNQVSGKTLEPRNNPAHDRAAEPAPGPGAEERARTTHSHVPGDRYSQPPLSWDIHENIPHPAHGEQSDNSQPRRSREVHTAYVRNTSDEHVTAQSHTRFARDLPMTEGMPVNSTESTRLRLDASPINTRHEPVSVNARDRSSLSANQVIWGIPEEEIKETISATIKEKLHSDADSVTAVSQSMQALDVNAQYWSNLSNKAARCSWRALELQLKLAEEKVNNLLHEEAPEEVLLEAAREVRTIRFQLDQNSQLREAGLMPEQQVQFSADTGRNVASPSRNYGPNPISEPHIPPSEVNVPLGRQSTPALSTNAQLDGAVVNMTSEYSGIQEMVRQALKNASHEEEPEKSFLAKAGVKMGNPPTYNGERNLKRFKTWVANVLQYMSMYNLLGPRAGKIQIQFLGQCLVDEAQEWFYRQAERFDREIKHWDLESIMMGLQKWFMPTLSLNKVAVKYDCLMQGNMTVQQFHQELTKLAKQMVELPNAYSYR
ncbi:hypothetical protein M422DRAFT_267263 [Sphaerobolus stellatus SS14]|uniref:Retrotransposon gag domain-containing protein n=1 Tax=Sphaerobolus stellatus (strain SS14) TaxID=990650 RepID=A0A0C9V098_SPHS4|nr:hypothetical protein M422DRAFT_267263 [Sphaerobolus stellatus SS14]